MAKLTPDDILRLSEPIEKVYSDIVDALLINMAKHFNSGYSLSTQEWEIQKLAEIGQLTEESLRIIADLTGQNPELVHTALEGAVDDALRDVEPELKKGVSSGKLPAPEASSALASKSITQALTAYDGQALSKLNLVNTTMLESTINQYRKIISNTTNIERKMQSAQNILNTQTGRVVTGTASRREALYDALSQIHEEGITGFFDKAGHAWSPEAYVNMDMRTTVHNTAIESVKMRMQDYGTQIFAVSRHSGARPLCYPYQGRYFSWDNSSGTFVDGEGKQHRYYPLSSTSYGKPAGLFGINCGHHPITVIPGVTIMRDRTAQDKEENDRTYRLSQEQRKLERDIRYAQRKAAMLDAAGDTEGFDAEALKIKNAQAKYNAFCKQTGRAKRLDRTRVYEYNNNIDNKVSAAAKRAEKAKAEQEEAKRLQKLELEKQKSQKTAEIQELIKSDTTLKKLNVGKQNQHIRESKGYKEGKSYIYGDLNTAQKIVDKYHGTGEIRLNKKTGQWEWNNKEFITLPEDVGVYINNHTGETFPTNAVSIHYGKKGTHIVPARRKET